MNYPVLITQQGETIAVAYDQAGIELAVQEHYDDSTLQLFAAQGGVASFNTGLVCDLEEVVVYPTWVSEPKTHTVNGVEIPDLRFTPKTYEEYYFPSPDSPTLAFRTRANYAHFNAADEHRIEYNLCYPPTDEGREAAILHAKAVLGIK